MMHQDGAYTLEKGMTRGFMITDVGFLEDFG
jgi:hypothetical protein